MFSYAYSDKGKRVDKCYKYSTNKLLKFTSIDISTLFSCSILEYLKTKTTIDEAKLRALISYGKEDDELAAFDKNEKKQLINALYTVTIIDPACGSGAFPIGMLQKIVYMLQEIDPEANLWFDKATENVSILIKKEFEKKFNAGSLDYIRKLSVIQNSIFGVDIQPIAVEIARLRCFLSLVIEEKVYDDEPNRGINPLPSLDFKFIIANSLVALEESPQLSLFENQDHIDELRAVRDEYFNADTERKTELKLEFADIQKRMFQETISNYNKSASSRYKALSDWSPFSNESTSWFDAEWMFGIKDGFDIVIGNPPYGLLNKKQNQKSSIQVTDKEINYYKTFPLYAPAKGGMLNIYRLFICQSHHLLKANGHNQYESSRKRHSKVDEYDYIERPKPSGYRSYHARQDCRCGRCRDQKGKPRDPCNECRVGRHASEAKKHHECHRKRHFYREHKIPS